MEQEQKLKRPVHLDKKDLVAIIGIYDTPVTEGLDKKYTKSELAFNEVTQRSQVYVMAETQAGLNEFKKDYPNAEIRQDATLDSLEEWTIVAFPIENMPAEGGTPLDNYFQARGREAAEINRIVKRRKGR